MAQRAVCFVLEKFHGKVSSIVLADYQRRRNGSAVWPRSGGVIIGVSIGNGSVQFFKQLVYINFVYAGTMFQFFQVGNLTFETVQPEAFQHRNCQREASADFADFHVLGYHAVSSADTSRFYCKLFA
jgi:hypothetical protein